MQRKRCERRKIEKKPCKKKKKITGMIEGEGKSRLLVIRESHPPPIFLADVNQMARLLFKSAPIRGDSEERGCRRWFDGSRRGGEKKRKLV